MTFPDYARLGTLEALHFHAATALLQAILENPPQNPSSAPALAIDSPISLSWTQKAWDLSQQNLKIFT